MDFSTVISIVLEKKEIPILVEEGSIVLEKKEIPIFVEEVSIKEDARYPGFSIYATAKEAERDINAWLIFCGGKRKTPIFFSSFLKFSNYLNLLPCHIVNYVHHYNHGFGNLDIRNMDRCVELNIELTVDYEEAKTFFGDIEEKEIILTRFDLLDL